jgi:hypothetical protein
VSAEVNRANEAPAADDDDVCGKYGIPSSCGYEMICTRHVGHDGDHVGHGAQDEELGRWPQ